MKRLDENSYYGRMERRAYEDGRKDGMIIMTIVMIIVWIVIWALIRFG